MSLKRIFEVMKKEGYVVKDLEAYLLSLSSTDSDRAIDVNAPSQIGKCLRERYYARTGCESEGVLDPRSRRVLDNGTHVHIRLQEYLKNQGILLLDEVPVVNDEYNIQGHTDGVLSLGAECAILEIKSINDKGFNELIDAKPEHKMQGLTYVYCIEQRRKYLHSTYNDMAEFFADEEDRNKQYASYYTHLKDGSKYTRQEKVEFQVDLHQHLDYILMGLTIPVTKCIFLYENKNTQQLKEFCVNSKSPESSDIIDKVLSECATLNDAVLKGKIPDRIAKSPSSPMCRWCNFKSECWN